MSSVKKNFLYSSFFQVYALILSFASAPYLSRVLGPQALGINTYVSTIVQYFAVFGVLSSDFFASRELIYSNLNKEVFWNLWFLRTFTLTIASVFYIFFVLFSREYKVYFLIGFIVLLSQFFNITWYYYAVEDFKTLALRNFLVRTLSFIPIFFVVKSPADLWKLIFLGAFTMFIANLILFVKPVGENLPLSLNLRNSLKLFPKAVKMFLPEISISIYQYVDKLMIKWFSDVRQVGLYEVASKLPFIVLSLMSSLTPIMMSRLTNLLAKSDEGDFFLYVKKSLKYGLLLSTLFTLLLMSTARDFVPWFFGQDYIESVKIVYIKAFVVMVISMGTVAGHQALVSLKKEKYLTVSVTFGAIINVVLNSLLIPKYKALGAAVASLLAEILVAVLLYMFLARFISLRPLLNELFQTVVLLIVQFAVCVSLTSLNFSWPINGGIMFLSYALGAFLVEENLRKSLSLLLKTLKKFD